MQRLERHRRLNGRLRRRISAIEDLTFVVRGRKLISAISARRFGRPQLLAEVDIVEEQLCGRQPELLVEDAVKDDVH